MNFFYLFLFHILLCLGPCLATLSKRNKFLDRKYRGLRGHDGSSNICYNFRTRLLSKEDNLEGQDWIKELKMGQEEIMLRLDDFITAGKWPE